MNTAVRFNTPSLLAAWISICIGMAGCATNTQPPSPRIQDLSTSLRAPEASYRTVRSGDTLYSIAWEIGRDYRELAKWNHIDSPYVIKPGQKLRLLPASAGARGTSSEPIDAAPGSTATTVAAAQPAERIEGRPIPPTETATPAPRPPAASKKKSATQTSSSRRSAGAKTSKTENGLRASPSGKWSWPIDGRVGNRQKQSGQKGLDIRGTRGEPVRAASDGRVVYQGSGLRGYGQLIIIKHNDEFLSAYAHNERIRVKEGETVRRGQHIADMGSTGTDRVKLHFEIRRHGAPVDPLIYLPKH